MKREPRKRSSDNSSSSNRRTSSGSRKNNRKASEPRKRKSGFETFYKEKEKPADEKQDGGDRSRGKRTSDNTFKKKERKRPFGKGRYENQDEEAKTPRHSSVTGSFRKGDKKMSHKKFLNDKKFKGRDTQKTTDEVRLNKYIANAGICSRREADKLIESGVVSINGKVVTALGTKVKPGDSVQFGGETLRREKMVYLLLNKPKDYISTVDDPQKRRTVLDLIHKACRERIYPVGRLDRNTTGLLLMTNDGDLTKKLTHPSHGVKKIYHVQTDKNVSKNDLVQLTRGIKLEDGESKADNVSYVGDGSSKNEVGIELHSGKNRIVRRMFEALGYKVVKLDRVYFAGLTKKGLPRSRWRFLTDQELGMLKML